MRKINHNKLVRDKMVEVIDQRGGKYKTRTLNKKEYEKELKKKLLEESKEVLEAPKKKLVDELSDILEIIKSIASYHKINFNKIENHQIKKRKERGGFVKRLFLVWSSDR